MSTLKEEIRDILNPNGVAEAEWNVKWLDTTVDQILSAIKDRLPKKLDENWRRTEQEPTKDEQTFIEGFNECLLQVSKIIEE